MDMQPVLDAMEGVTYAVYPTGIILGCGRPNWNRFVARNQGPTWLQAERIVGRNLFDFIHGAEVVARYHTWLASLAAADLGPLTFDFRCDAPDERREMRMAITRLEQDGQLFGFLFQSTALTTTTRPSLNVYDSSAVIAARLREATLPVVQTCSFCQRLGWPPGGEPEIWVEADDYYRLGGRSQVRLSHGICPACTGALPR
jgi:hypothetical protein